MALQSLAQQGAGVCQSMEEAMHWLGAKEKALTDLAETSCDRDKLSAQMNVIQVTFLKQQSVRD